MCALSTDNCVPLTVIHHQDFDVVVGHYQAVCTARATLLYVLVFQKIKCCQQQCTQWKVVRTSMGRRQRYSPASHVQGLSVLGFQLPVHCASRCLQVTPFFSFRTQMSPPQGGPYWCLLRSSPSTHLHSQGSHLFLYLFIIVIYSFYYFILSSALGHRRLSIFIEILEVIGLL